MSVIDSFRRLGIEPTRDKHQIRKAYAAMASQCHPETNPEEWKILHDAYKNALEYAEGQVVKSSGTSGGFGWGYGKKSPEDDWKEDETKEEKNGDGKKNQVSGEYDDLFRNLASEAENERNQLKQELLQMIKKIKWSHFFIKKKHWGRLFSSEAYLKCCDDEEIVDAILNLVTRKKYGFESMEIIYRSLWELQVYLHGEKSGLLARKVNKIISWLELQWDYTEKARTKRTGRIRRFLWKLHQNFWHLPFWYRLVFYEVISMIVMIVALKPGIFGIWAAMELFHISRAKTGSEFEKLSKFERVFLGGALAVLAFSMVFICIFSMFYEG